MPAYVPLLPVSACLGALFASRSVFCSIRAKFAPRHDERAERGSRYLLRRPGRTVATWIGVVVLAGRVAGVQWPRQMGCVHHA